MIAVVMDETQIKTRKSPENTRTDLHITAPNEKKIHFFLNRDHERYQYKL